MNNEERFEQLKKLLALKRYEQPPPGYFDRLSRQIISAIEAEQARPEPWLRRIWATLQGKPAFAGAFGVVICALLIGGIFFANQTNKLSSSKDGMAANSNTALVAPAAPQLADANVSSTNPVLSSQAPTFLFDASLLRSGHVSLPVSAPAGPH